MAGADLCLGSLARGWGLLGCTSATAEKAALRCLGRPFKWCGPRIPCSCLSGCSFSRTSPQVASREPRRRAPRQRARGGTESRVMVVVVVLLGEGGDRTFFSLTRSAAEVASSMAGSPKKIRNESNLRDSYATRAMISGLMSMVQSPCDVCG